VNRSSSTPKNLAPSEAARPAPRSEDELLVRARALAGRSLASVAAELGAENRFEGVHTKGKAGQLVERALGASGGSSATWDFPELRIELKTIPVDASGTPRESTYVCTVSLADAERAEWDTSWARAKLSRVLWVPVVRGRVERQGTGPTEKREAHLGEPLLWSPTPEQERILAGDFDEILGRIGAGGIEGLTAHAGRWLQLRPKAAHGRVRTVVRGQEGDLVATVPRGFYLRARFSGGILRDPHGLP
jgi:DNA mismatch repair protein MutH